MNRLLFVLMFVLIPAGASAQSPNETMSPGRKALWDEIVAANDSMAAAFNRGEMLRAASFFADSALIASDGMAVRGRAEIDRIYAGTKDRQWRLEVIRVGGNNDIAYQIGRSHITRTAGPNAGSTRSSDFVVIWQRDASGRLRIALDLM